MGLKYGLGENLVVQIVLLGGIVVAQDPEQSTGGPPPPTDPTPTKPSEDTGAETQDPGPTNTQIERPPIDFPQTEAPSSSGGPNSTSASVGAENTSPAPTPPTFASGPTENSTTFKATTGVFAALFAITLAVAIFLFIKRRQDRSRAYKSAAFSPESAYSDKGANAQIESLQGQLADANKRLTAVQGSLLTAGQKPQTKDDNTLSREYTQIGTDINAWTGNYFKASSDAINLTSELYEFLTEHIPNYQKLLSHGKSKQLVVRAIVSQVLQESFENQAFFGNALSSITPLIRTSSAPPVAINSWRSETFFLLEKSDDFNSQRRAGITAITDKIEQLTYPLAANNQKFQGDPARVKFLEGIIAKASDFAVALGKQRANFQLLSEPAGCEFAHVTMDDVSQSTDIITNADGTTSHPLEGRPIQATIFPLLMKYGNESGEGYDQITILSRAKVSV